MSAYLAGHQVRGKRDYPPVSANYDRGSSNSYRSGKADVALLGRLWTEAGWSITTIWQSRAKRVIGEEPVEDKVRMALADAISVGSRRHRANWG